MVSIETLSARKRVRKLVWILPLVLLAGLSLFAVIGLRLRNTTVSHVPAAGGTLTVNLDDSSRYINPLLASTETDSAVTSLLFRGLTTRAPDGALTPDLALHWTTGNGGKTFTFALRPKARWSNGKLVTSYDVAYTYRLLTASNFPSHSDYWNGLRVSTPSATTVVFHLPQPDFNFPQQTTMGIVPANYVKYRQPVASGSFRLTSVNASGIHLAPVTGKRQPATYISALDVSLTPPGPKPVLTCTSTFGAGIARKQGLRRAYIPTTRLLGMAFNLKRLPDLAIRHALIAALRTSSSITGATPNWPGLRAPPALARLPYAETSMHKDGWKLVKGLWTKHGKHQPIVLVAPKDALLSPVLAPIVSAWQKSGFIVTVKRSAFPNLVRQVLQPGGFDAAMLEWDYGSPDYDPGLIWSTRSPLNFGRVSDRTVDTLSSQVRSQPRAGKRSSLRDMIAGRLISLGAGIGIAPQLYACTIPPALRNYQPPTLVTSAAGLLFNENTWYLKTKAIYHTPF